MNSKAPAPEVAFSHIGLFVHDLDAMVDFYHRVLGFTITDRASSRPRRAGSGSSS